MPTTRATATASTKPKPFVFVLMPFKPEFNDIYELGIKAACKAAGAYCERVDEQLYQGSMLERIYNQIAKADVLVADTTGKNPNVYYEVGYAHALGKHVMLMTQDANDIPFDLQHHRHIVYGGKITDLKKALTRDLKWALSNPGPAPLQYTDPLEYYTAGELLTTETRQVHLTLSGATRHYEFSINIHNASDSVVKEQREFALIFSNFYIFMVKSTSPIALPNNKSMLMQHCELDLLPDGWETVTFSLADSSDFMHLHVLTPMRITVKIKTPYGAQQYHVNLVTRTGRVPQETQAAVTSAILATQPKDSDSA